MEFSQIEAAVVPSLLVAFLARRYLKSRQARKALPGLLQEGAVIVDVRSRSEVAAGGNPKSINIPLDELDAQIGKLDSKKPIVVCCASGTRSAMAVSLLKRKGFSRVTNAGPWQNTVLNGGH